MLIVDHAMVLTGTGRGGTMPSAFFMLGAYSSLLTGPLNSSVSPTSRPTMCFESFPCS